MRLRLWIRRLTVSAPRMAVRSALPWPLRWALAASIAGFCAALGMWAFEFGRSFAGLDPYGRDQIERLRQERDGLRQQLQQAQADRQQAQSLAQTADVRVASERALAQQLQQQNQQLLAENRRLRDDLGFFERLIPSTSVAAADSAGLAIRGLQLDAQPEGGWRWQVLLIQAVKNPAEFSGTLELTLRGLRSGQPWQWTPPEGELPVRLRQYVRLDGVLRLPSDVRVHTITARVLQGNVVRATHSQEL